MTATPAEPLPASERGDVTAGYATVTLVLALLLIAYGLYAMHEAPAIVGGDAYNYQIGATRGVGWITAGVGLAVAGVIFSLMSVRAAVLGRR